MHIACSIYVVFVWCVHTAIIVRFLFYITILHYPFIFDFFF